MWTSHYVLLLTFLFSADRSETLPCDRKYVQFHKLCRKIWGPSQRKNLGAKNVAKFGAISVNFRRRSQIHVYPTQMEISKIGKLYSVSTAIPPVFGEESPVNFGPLTTKLGM